MRRVLVLALLVFLIPASRTPVSQAFPGRPSVVSETTGTLDLSAVPNVYYGNLDVSFDWVSNASGDLTGVVGPFYGDILKVSFIPHSTTAPATGVDCQVKTTDGEDILGSAWVNLATTTLTVAAPVLEGTTITNSFIPYPVMGNLTIVVDQAGDSKRGTLRFIGRNR